MRFKSILIIVLIVMQLSFMKAEAVDEMANFTLNVEKSKKLPVLTPKFNTSANVEKVIKKLHTVLYPNKHIEVHEVLILRNKENLAFVGDVELPLPEHYSNFKVESANLPYTLADNNVFFKNVTIFPNSTIEISFSYVVNSNNFSRPADSITYTIILVRGSSVVDKSPLLTFKGMNNFAGKEFEVFEGKIGGKSYYILVSNKGVTSKANPLVILGIVMFSLGLSMLLFGRNNNWKIKK